MRVTFGVFVRRESGGTWRGAPGPLERGARVPAAGVAGMLGEGGGMLGSAGCPLGSRGGSSDDRMVRGGGG